MLYTTCSLALLTILVVGFMGITILSKMFMWCINQWKSILGKTK